MTQDKRRLRRKGISAFSFQEKELIQKGIREGLTWKKIKEKLLPNRSHFSIRNEVTRNGGGESYSPEKSEERRTANLERKRQLLAALQDTPSEWYESKDVRYKRHIEERLYAIEQQLQIIFDIINQKEKNGTNHKV